MIDVHIDDFYHDIAATLLSLYQQFPRKVSLYIEDVSGPDDVDEFGLHSQRHLSCMGAMLWLQDEGYIRFEELVREEAIEAATLTQKAFVQLIQPRTDQIEGNETSATISPSARDQRFTLANQLHEALVDRNSILVRSLVERYFLHS
jgi:hypothetical protein